VPDDPKLSLQDHSLFRQWNAGQVSFMLARACDTCRGSGITQDVSKRSLLISESTTLDELRCPKCLGAKHAIDYIDADALFTLMWPVFIQSLERALPDLVQKLRIELVRDIMEC